ncbi:MAG: pyridine nucleotide-disulfide oxidoreductase [Desulfobacteraceae bacterium 4572_35.1]|nr:MAG: pyridine nucleotide-disulfide oxidoreductase [Desulfobacteraceae bacterium 4572_35.1]
MESRKIVIIGGVAAGMKTACRLRRLDADVSITAIDRTSDISYGACPLPYYIEGLFENLDEVRRTPVGVLRDEIFFKNAKGFDTLTRTEATAINRDQKTIRVRNLDSGEQQDLPYDILVLATGNTPIVPKLPGIELNGVVALKTMKQAQQIDTMAKTAKSAVIVGGGLIGLEVAEALIHRGIKVTLLEMKDQIMATALDFGIASLVHREMRKHGVDMRLSESLQRIEGSGKVERVVTEHGSYSADLVLIAIGVRPVVDLAQDADIDLGVTGAIAVNEQMQTSDPCIYAVGDCVESNDIISGRKVYVPLGSTANKHGRVAANNISGQPERFPGILGSMAVKVFDISVARTGLSAEDALLNGYDAVSIRTSAPDIAHLYPGSKPIVIKLVADRKTRKLLGAQIVGPGVVDKRIDVIVSALSMGATVDQLAQFDLSYAPPFATAMDAILQCANALRNKMDGLVDSMSPAEVCQRLEQGEDIFLLDVRSPAEFDEVRISGATLIPLGALRNRLDEVPRDRLVAPFCKLSMRGFEAQIVLQQAGFTNVRYIEGGIVAWPYELEM